MLGSRWNIKCIWPEKTIDFFFKFGNIGFIKSSLKYFCWEYHHCFIEVSISFLVWQNFTLKLHERMGLVVLSTDTCVLEDNPTILISHFLGLLRKLLLFWWKHLRNWKTSLFGFLLQNLLLIFKSEKFPIVIKHCLKQILVLLRSSKLIKVWWNLLAGVTLCILHHLCQCYINCITQDETVLVLLWSIIIITILSLSIQRFTFCIIEENLTLHSFKI